MWGCAPQEPPQPLQPLADVSKRFSAMKECRARAQGAVNAGALAPANSSIADIRDALDEAKKLAQQGKQAATGFRSAQQCGAIQLSVIFEFLCLTSALITFMYTALNPTARFRDSLQNRLAGPAKGFGARTIPQSEGLGMG